MKDTLTWYQYRKTEEGKKVLKEIEDNYLDIRTLATIEAIDITGPSWSSPSLFSIISPTLLWST